MAIPSLNTLRAFEAAVRFQSFAKAADHLGLTHSALSHQMAQLTVQTGTPLFIRRGRQMIPTEAAQSMLVSVREALVLLNGAFGRAPRRNVLRLSTLPSFATLWLSPRLGGFFSDNPDVSINLDPTTQPVSLGSANTELAIRFGLGRWPDVESHFLGHEWVIPVCSPDFNERAEAKTPTEIAQMPLIDDPTFTWTTWFEAMGHHSFHPRPIVMVADSTVATAMAANGLGVALARLRLVYNDIAKGKLIQLASEPLQTRQSYHFVTNHSPRNSQLVERFHQWLTDAFMADLTLLEMMGIPLQSRI